MISWDDFRYILALNECGNLARAAASLKTNPTTVSRHIKRLSEVYGVTLFRKTNTGQWELTEQGRRFVDTAKTCQTAIEGLVDDSGDSPTCDITLSTTEFVAETYLIPQLDVFVQQHPQIALTLDMQDRNVSLAYGEADLAIRLGRPQSGRLVVSKLGDLPMGTFSQDGKRTDEWVGLPRDCDWVPEMQLGYEVFKKPPAVRIGSFSSIRRVALTNGMACIGPNAMMQDWNGLRPLHGQNAFAAREVWSVFHEDRKHDATLEHVRNWAKDCFDGVTEAIAA